MRRARADFCSILRPHCSGESRHEDVHAGGAFVLHNMGGRTATPEITKDGVKPFPSDGARKLNSRVWFFYLATGATPAMCMRLENVGSQDHCDLPRYQRRRL